MSRLVALCAAWVALAVDAGPVAAGEVTAPPPLRARAAILVDAATGEVMHARAANDRRPIASATKLMTALLVLERAQLDDVFVAPAYRALPAESKIGLRRGERMRVRDLLTALLLESANDAARSIAVNVDGSERRFVNAMNRRAAELGLADTRYANSIGFDDPDNHSTARDLAALARRLLRDRRFARIVDRPRANLRTGDRPRAIANRNELVGRHPFVDGVKTGHTRTAGYVLVGAGHARGARVISVVLGEPSAAARDADTLELLAYGLRQFRRVRILVAGATIARLPIRHRDELAPLTTSATVSATIRRGRRVRRRVLAPPLLDGPLPQGVRVGTVQVVYRGRVLSSAALVTARAVPGEPPLGGGSGQTLIFVLLAAIVTAGAAVGLRRRRRRPPGPAGRVP